MSKPITRRDVLKSGAQVALGASVLGLATKGSASPIRPKAERLRVGVIGVGGKGWSGMQWAAEYGDIVALCDVDTNERARGMAEYPYAVSFQDYRHMIDAYSNNLDAVIISTPDHHHYVAGSLAIKAGLHVYGEKPLTRTISEARKLGQLAKKHGVATQMGNQSTASNPMRMVAEHIKRGTFGHVKSIYLWTDRAGGWWKQGIERPPVVPTPDNLDFYIWLGPRPDRDYGEGYHPFAWRGFWDFGTGSLGDMGCHIFNMPHMALNLRDPLTVQAETSGHNRESFPSWSVVHYEFPARDGRPAFDLTWHDGGKKPDPSLAPGFEYGGNGVIVVCENATIYSPDSENTTFHIVGGGEFEEIEYDESPGHMAEFFRAAEGGKKAKANFPDYASPMTETVLLGNLAIWADGPKLEWDARRMKVKGTDEFDDLIWPTYKTGWEG